MRSLVERGPRIALVVIGQAEGVQQLVIGAIEENGVAFIDDDEGDRVDDLAVARSISRWSCIADRCARRKRCVISAPKAAAQRGLEIFLVDQSYVDVGVPPSRPRCSDADWELLAYSSTIRCMAAARSMLPPAITCGADRMIEAADAARPRADAQVGAEGERHKSALQFGGDECVYCGGAPLNEPGGAGCSAGGGQAPHAGNAMSKARNAASDPLHDA